MWRKLWYFYCNGKNPDTSLKTLSHICNSAEITGTHALKNEF